MIQYEKNMKFSSLPYGLRSNPYMEGAGNSVPCRGLGQRPNVPRLKLKLVRRADDQLRGLRIARLRLGARGGFPFANGFLRGLLGFVPHPAHELMQRRHPRKIGGNDIRHAVRT